MGQIHPIKGQALLAASMAYGCQMEKRSIAIRKLIRSALPSFSRGGEKSHKTAEWDQCIFRTEQGANLICSAPYNDQAGSLYFPPEISPNLIRWSFLLCKHFGHWRKRNGTYKKDYLELMTTTADDLIVETRSD